MARVDYDKQSEVYDKGRTLPSEAIAQWMVAARRHAGDGVGRILDLGCGTARFSAALADAFGATVVGIEPSSGMLAQAASKPHPCVHLIRGAAEHLPLPDASVDVAWLSNVIHHVDDVPAAAGELRRVVAQGTVLVRGAFGGSPVPSLYRFFPGSQQFVDSFPSVPEIIEKFQSAGFRSFYHEKVEQFLASSLADMVPRMRMRADTTLELLSDDEFEQGMRKLEQAAHTESGPVIDGLDLLVIR